MWHKAPWSRPRGEASTVRVGAIGGTHGGSEGGSVVSGVGCGQRCVVLTTSWEPWYVSNVSIIFDAPCLFYTICFIFCLHFVAFYAISGTNLLTRCHSVSSLFSAIFVFQKSYRENILGIGRNKDRNSYFYQTKDEDRKRAGGEGRRGQAHHEEARPPSWPCPAVVRPPWWPSDAAWCLRTHLFL
jgi:hypothetical protein